MLLAIFVVLTLLVAAIVAAWLLATSGNVRWPDRAVMALTPVAWAVAILSAVLFVRAAPWWDFNAARLAPTIGMFSGYHAYNLPNDGPVLCPHYPPLAVLVFLPAALAKGPTVAILIASACSAAVFFAPLGVWWRAVRVLGQESGAWLAALLSAAIMLYAAWQPALRSVAYSVGPDGAAIGFGILAACALSLAAQRQSLAWLVASALAAACSVWSKQTMVVVPAVLPVWGLFVLGRRRWLYAVLVGAFCLGFLGVFTLAFGWDRLWFNAITMMRESAWLDLEALGQSHDYPWRLLKWSVPLLVIGLAAFGLARRGRGVRAWLVEEPGMPLLLVAISLAPMCLLSRVKVGGDDHHYAPCLTFLAYFAVISLLSAYRSSHGAQGVPLVACAICVTLLALPTASSLAKSEPLGWYVVQRCWNSPSVFDNPQQAAFRRLLAEPDTFYFPWNPLSALYAEGKLYHFSYGLVDRRIAGFPPTQEHFDRFIPRKFKVVCVSDPRLAESPGAQDWQTYLPRFGHPNPAYAMPGWTCVDDRTNNAR